MIQLNRSNAATLILLSLLIAALLLTAALTFEAVTAERAHQAAVRRAIRDDASVVADDLLRRTVYEFEMFVSRPLRLVIANHLREQNTMPLPADLAIDDRVSDAAFVIDRLFLIDTKHGFVSPPLPEPLQSWMLTKFPPIVRARRRRRRGDPRH